MNTNAVILIAIVCLFFSILYFGKWIYRRSFAIRSRLHMSNLFTNITHELMAPLTIISASVEKMRNEHPDYEEEYALIDLNINRAVRLLQQMMESGKSQQGELRLMVRNGDIMQYIKETARSTEPLMRGKLIEFNIHCHPESMMGWMDTEKLDKIIFNLLINAINNTEKNGIINLDVSTNSYYDQIIIRISDNGLSIPPQNAKNLFTRLYDRKKKGDQDYGAVIGLSLTRDLVHLHGGTIQYSDDEGHGNTFIVRLPIKKDAFSSNQIEEKQLVSIPENSILDLPKWDSTTFKEQQAVLPDNEDAPHVLLVENNEELLTLMKKLLQNRYHIITATNGQEALDTIHANSVDIIVADVTLPQMNGYEMTIQIKQDTDLGHLPVILLTTKMLEEERLEALTAGADDLISKPFRLRELQLRIDNIIANRHRIHGEQYEKKEETIEHITPQHQLTADQEYVRRAIKCINDHITDTEYSREDFAADMGNSVSTLYNKIRSLTGKSVTNFSREIRIKTACRLAKENPDLRVSDIAYQVGYKDPKYFATSFKRVMGIQPKEYFLKLRDEK